MSLISLEADAGSSAQPEETSYPYVGVSPRKDNNHHGTSQAFQSPYFLPKKIPLSTTKPPCLNLCFETERKVESFCLKCTNTSSLFKIPPFWKTPFNFPIKPSNCDLKAISFNTDWLLQEGVFCTAERGFVVGLFFPQWVKGSEGSH